MMKSLTNSAKEKHVQMWFTDPAAQACILGLGWSDAIDPPVDTTDVLAVSNSVVKLPAKANLGVSKTLDYEVQLNPDGSADTRLMLGYKKTYRSPLGDLQKWLANYVRVHRTDGTTRTAGAGTKGFTSLKDETGLPTFGHYFQLDRGKSTSVDLRTVVPQAARAGSAATITGEPDANLPGGAGGWHYRLLLARQTDLVDTIATVSVRVPSGWKVAGTTAWLRVSGTRVDTSVTNDLVKLGTTLNQDLLVDVTLTRA